MAHATGFRASITRAFSRLSPRRHPGEVVDAVKRAEAGIAAGGPVAMPVSALAPTVNADIDDACVGCEAKSGYDCGRCAYLLDAINRLPVMPEIEKVAQPKPIFLPALSGPDAAVSFVRYLRDNDKCGSFSTRRLQSTYLLFCQQERRRPTAENVLRASLSMLPGVTKESIRDRSQSSHRSRIVEWVISPAETVSQTVSRRPRLVAHQSEQRPAA
jgi:hypothetical protein